VKIPRRWSEVSVFGRTFMLMLAALVITGAVGSILAVSWPPSTDDAVPLSVLVRLLSIPGEEPSHERPPPPGFDRGPHGPFDPRFGPAPGGEFGPGPPPDLAQPPSALRLVTMTSRMAPLIPGGAGLVATESLRNQLAQQLHLAPSKVILYTVAAIRDAYEGTASSSADPGDALLRQNFIAARELPDGSWRSVRRIAAGFPDAFQRRALLSVTAGLAALLALAWQFARALVAPIRRFSDAARRLGHDPNAPLLLREGPPEILLAVDSFNSMQARISRLIQERTNMVGAIAHDLRTPLTRLAFRLDDLPHPLSERVGADIQEMKSMISAALNFIRDRSFGGQRERLDLRLLVERVVDDQSDLGHDVTLQPGTPITVEGVPLALRRLATNLVDNAVKYGERARLQLRADKDHCFLEIDDDGPGIPEQLQEQVFEPFFRLEASRNRDTGGIGLGLASVRAIVMDHGGEITLGNRKGGGLRVVVSLPVAVD
jgi:signal transduction histidine kinase